MDLNLRTINYPDTAASSRTEGRRVFEIKFIYMRTLPMTVNVFLGV